MRNCSLDFLRSKKSRKEVKCQCIEAGTTPWLESVAGHEPGPERLMHSAEIAQLLEPALNSLSEMERTAFVLRHYEGCDIGEIARVLGVETNAAKHSVFRAVQKLRRALDPAWGVMR